MKTYEVLLKGYEDFEDYMPIDYSYESDLLMVFDQLIKNEGMNIEEAITYVKSMNMGYSASELIYYASFYEEQDDFSDIYRWDN